MMKTYHYNCSKPKGIEYQWEVGMYHIEKHGNRWLILGQTKSGKSLVCFMDGETKKGMVDELKKHFDNIS